jgi:hypothetical protein
MECPLARYICRSVWHRLLVEFTPATVPIGFFARRLVDAAMSLHYCLGGCEKLFVNASSHQGAPATNRFRVEVCMLFGYTGRSQQTNQAARCATRCGASDSSDRCRGQPTGGHHRTNARDGEQSETGKQTNAAPDRSAGGCTGFGSSCGPMGGITGRIVSVGPVGHYAYVGVRDVGGRKITHGLRSLIIVIIQACEGFGCHECLGP